jgi:hypothetical protein
MMKRWKKHYSATEASWRVPLDVSSFVSKAKYHKHNTENHETHSKPLIRIGVDMNNTCVSEVPLSLVSFDKGMQGITPPWKKLLHSVLTRTDPKTCAAKVLSGSCTTVSIAT